MGFFSAIKRVGKAASALSRSPLGKVAGMVPGLGTVVGAVGMAGTAYSAYKGLTGGGGGGGVPAAGLPALAGGPVMPGGIAITPGQTGGFGLPRGPGGRMQLPWNDPSIPEYLKQFALDDSFLRTAVRAPKGYVVVKDASGRPFAVLKSMAKAFKLWRPKPRPPISVRDWHALQHAHHTIKVLNKVEKKARAIARYAGHGKHTSSAHTGRKKK